MSGQKLLVILGITGNQGGSVAKVFRNIPGWRIRGVTRNPSSPSAASLRDAGIELVSANLDDPESLRSAFKGAVAIYAVTDFWQFLKDPSTFAEAQKQGKKPNEIALQREVVQGMNIISAASHHVSSLERFVLSTLSDSKKWSNGEIQWNVHFDGKAIFTQRLKDEYPELAARTSYLQMGYYLSNWQMGPMFAPTKQADGSFIVRGTAVPGGKPLPFVDPPNDTGYFVHALVTKAPAGTTMLGYCELMAYEKYAELWGKVNRVKARYEQPTKQQAIELEIPDWLVEETNESGKYVTTWGWDGGEPGVKSPREAGVDVSKLTKVEDWIRKEDWSSVM